MSQHERKAHVREVNNKMVDVSRAIVNRTDTHHPTPELAPVHKDQLTVALEELADMADDVEVEITLDDQIMILQETKKLVEVDIDKTPKVGFRADLDGVANKREFLTHLEDKLEELQVQSLKETENKIKEAAMQMSRYTTTGFTSQRSEAVALQTYVEDLIERLGSMRGKMGLTGPL